MAMNRPKGITRHEIPERNSFGWVMRIRRGSREWNEFFADSKYGGPRKAKKAARARYLELAARLPAAMSPTGRKTVRNKTGKVGVHVAMDPRPRGTDREDYYYYVASWLDEQGQRVTIRFSWSKYGKRLARRLATIARDHATTDRRLIYSVYRRTTGRIIEA